MKYFTNINPIFCLTCKLDNRTKTKSIKWQLGYQYPHLDYMHTAKEIIWRQIELMQKRKQKRR